MNKVYINGMGSVSAQRTFEKGCTLENPIAYQETVLPICKPNYRDFIAPAAARRMAQGIKMGVVASALALQEAAVDEVDAIITGTGLGCTIDSEKFLEKLIDNKEAYLTPTSFIQSTHNAVGGQIALGIGCKAYNFTYVHGSVSFESAVMDALMQLKGEEAADILLGGVDENGAHTIEIHKLIGHIKKDSIPLNGLYESNSPGTVFGEGAHFFVLSTKKGPNSYAEMVDVATFNTLEPEEVSKACQGFLTENGLGPGHIDAIVLGCNGDAVYDSYYSKLVADLFLEHSQLRYKHLIGECYTASAFGVWLGAKVLRHQAIPEATVYSKGDHANLNTILLYNQYRGENHSFILLKRC